MRVTRAVLKETVTPRDLERAAGANGWSLEDVIMSTPDSPFEKIWLASDGRTRIHYIEDALISVRYVAVPGEDPGPVMDEVNSSLDTYDREELGRMFDAAEDRGHMVRAVYHVGAAAPPEFDAELFAYFERAFGSADSEVRRAAVFATAYAPWPEFRERLQRLASDDPEPAVRDYAARMLESHVKHAWGR